ncbi:MAG TPA: UDP-N-acetylmuramoyl-L-alanine--D-glutamate ligase [Candidatus Paceibacterota bacterium]|nr:UDP-N-acetylmuramoyl-L-alanine--D-glutamate ligase [Candidatus Paceibacterota bacterium]HMP18912.1 UDP-N-acetylmuramoyl-L-alanine--D-glutamate ligase [Candidatus Paceibacterota bacterium]
MKSQKKIKNIKIKSQNNRNKLPKVAVVGFGVTGKAVINFLKKENYEIHLFESKRKEDFDQNEINKNKDVIFHFEKVDFDPKEFSFVVTSPGASLEIPPIKKALKAHIPVHNDLTLFMQKWRKIGKVIGITGSNGKTTTASLLYDCLKKVTPTILGGNIGNSPLDLLDIKYPKNTIAVLEISSNQLDLFKPEDFLDICSITNLSSNHLDRYNGSMQEYAFAKMRGIDKKKTKSIICLDDPGSQKYILPKINCDHLYGISFEMPVDQAVFSGIYTNNSGDLIYAQINPKKQNIDFDTTCNFAETEILFDKTENRKLQGVHNLYNIAFVLLSIKLAGLSINQKIIKTIRNFVGLEHRIEKFAIKNGVTYINDSKSTSPDSIRAALEFIPGEKNTYLIAGGDDKDMSFDFLSEIFSEKLKKLIIIAGNIDNKLKKLAKKSNVDFVEIPNLSDAVKFAAKNSKKGEFVLLSPGSYSKNFFKNFEDRGTKFKKFVNDL